MARLHTGMAIGALCLSAPAALGQGFAQYNRAVRAVGVTPSSIDPGVQVVTAVFTVQATLLPTDPAPEGGGFDNLNTTVGVFLNGVLVGATPFEISVNPSTLSSCAASCGEGVTNGMTASLLCIDGECQFPPITAEIPVPSLQPKDEIMVLLMRATDAIPETDTSDDSRIVTYQGSPIGWNRAATEVSISPASGPSAPEGDQFFDIYLCAEFSSFGLTESLHLGAQPILLINGSPANNPFSGCDDWIASPIDLCLGCTNTSCGTASCGGDNIQLECVLIEDDYGFFRCACVGQAEFTFPNVFLNPGDEVDIVLRPVPGALPELPGFEDDDNGEPPAGCVLCPGDLNDDGIVDGADLANLLANWGICFPV